MMRNTKTTTTKAEKTTFSGSIKAFTSGIGEAVKSVGRAFQIPDWVMGTDYRPPLYQQTAEMTSRRLRDSVFTSACFNEYMNAAFSLRLICQKWDKKSNGWIRQAEHPVELTLDDPTGYQCPAEWLAMIMVNTKKDGNCLICVDHSDILRKTDSLEILHTDGVRPKLHKITLVKGYEVTKRGWDFASQDETAFIPRDEMVHVKLPNSERPEWGISPLEAAKFVQDTEALSILWNKDLFNNSGRPSFVLATPLPLNTRQRTQIRKNIIDDTAREFAGYPLVLTHDIKPVSLGKTPTELDQVNMTKLDAMRICALLGVPVSLIDPSQGATQASLPEVRKAFWKTSVLPLTELICQNLTKYWVSPRWGAKYRVWYDIAGVGVLREGLEKQAEILDGFFNKGLTLNELNSSMQLGFPNIDAGNIRVINGVVIDWAGITPAYETGPNEHNLGVGGDAPAELAKPTDAGAANIQPRKRRKAATEQEIKAIWNSIEADRKFLVSTHRARVAEQVQADYKSLADLPVALIVSGNLTDWQTKSSEKWARVLDRIWYDGASLFSNQFETRYGLSKSARRTKAALTGEDQTNLHDIAVHRAADIAATASHFIIDFVTKELASGRSEAEVSLALQAKIPQLTAFKADVIVENEVIAAGSYGNHIGAEKSGVYTLKTWRTRRDNRVRESHQGMEGETQLLSQPYSNELRFPCDPEGSADETINCRCFETYD